MSFPQKKIVIIIIITIIFLAKKNNQYLGSSLWTSKHTTEIRLSSELWFLVELSSMSRADAPSPYTYTMKYIDRSALQNQNPLESKTNSLVIQMWEISPLSPKILVSVLYISTYFTMVLLPISNTNRSYTYSVGGFDSK